LEYRKLPYGRLSVSKPIGENMTRVLTVEELGEIAEFARQYPEAIPQMRETQDPETLLERVRATITELGEGQDGQISKV
jgi:hypothetical protein